MSGVCKQLTILEKEAGEELRLGEEGDSLGRVDSCVVFAPSFLLSGMVRSNGQLWGEQEMGKCMLIFEELEQENGRGDVREEEERCQVKNLHGSNARKSVRGKRKHKYVWGGKEEGGG